MKTFSSPLAVVLVASLIGYFPLTLPPVGAAEPPSPTISWTGAASGLWNNTNNWSPTRLPLPTDHVAITGTTNFTVTLNVSATVASLALGADSGSVTQRLIVNDGVGLAFGTNSLVRARGELVLPNDDSHSLSGTGLLEVRGLLDWTAGGSMAPTRSRPGAGPCSAVDLTCGSRPATVRCPPLSPMPAP